MCSLPLEIYRMSRPAIPVFTQVAVPRLLDWVVENAKLVTVSVVVLVLSVVAILTANALFAKPTATLDNVLEASVTLPAKTYVSAYNTMPTEQAEYVRELIREKTNIPLVRPQ